MLSCCAPVTFTDTRFVCLRNVMVTTLTAFILTQRNQNIETFILWRQKNRKVGTNETGRWPLYSLLVVKIHSLKHKRIAVG